MPVGFVFERLLPLPYATVTSSRPSGFFQNLQVLPETETKAHDDDGDSKANREK
jgi:hypothetical protein